MQIFLDDIRTPTAPGWTVVRSFTEFQTLIDSLDTVLPVKAVSLDHDLGNDEEGTGVDAARYFCEHLTKLNEKILPCILIHSSNPPGAANIASIFTTYKKVAGIKSVIDLRLRDYMEGYSDYAYHKIF